MNNKKFGFTLAEVLVTLAIIGVVAALTLPTLMSNYRKKEVETKLQKFYATMQQAIKLSTIENGPTAGWEFSGTTNYAGQKNWFDRYLAKYLNYTKIEKSSDDSLLVYFLDGSLFTFDPAATTIAFYTRDCVTKNNCRRGVDQFYFSFHPHVVEGGNPKARKYMQSANIQPYVYAWDGTIDGAKDSSSIEEPYGCYKGKYAALCTKLIELNGWRIPNDYPYHF